MKRTVWAVIMVLCAAAEEARSQMRPPPGAFADPQVVFYEAINRPGGEDGLSRIDMQYRIAEGFFVAVLNDERSPDSPFKRNGEILVELIDSNGISRARDIDRFVIGATTSEREFGPPQWKQGSVSFAVPPGRYTILVEVDDLESDRRFIERSRTVRASAFDQDSVEYSTPFFVAGTFTGTAFPQTIAPVNHGGDLLFASRAGLFIQLASRTPISPVTGVRIRITEGSEDNAAVIRSDTLTVFPAVRGAVWTAREDTDGVHYTHSADENSTSVSVLIPLETAGLALRRYDLTATLVHAAGETTVRLPFRTVWPDMPFSLRDVDFAISVLRYITRPEQLDSLREGSFEERRENLELFWKEKDKSPNTVYNEVMTEYYRRVDHAMRTFGTLKEPDGSRADRGRIYILHGRPSKVERVLDPQSGYQEVWIYTGISRKFVFADETKSGNYVLIATQSL